MASEKDPSSDPNHETAPPDGSGGMYNQPVLQVMGPSTGSVENLRTKLSASFQDASKESERIEPYTSSLPRSSSPAMLAPDGKVTEIEASNYYGARGVPSLRSEQEFNLRAKVLANDQSSECLRTICRQTCLLICGQRCLLTDNSWL